MSGHPSPGGSAVDGSAGPSVEVVDDQGDVAVDAPRWAALAAAALLAEGAPADTELTLHFVDQDAMAALNAQHMGAEGPTDVLSFPLDLAEGVPTPDGPPGGDGAPVLAGDVVLCPAVARRNAPAHAGSLDDELALLVVHGVLHLLGHDHAEPDERERMQARERQLLARFHGPLAGDPWSGS